MGEPNRIELAKDRTLNLPIWVYVIRAPEVAAQLNAKALDPSIFLLSFLYTRYTLVVSWDLDPARLDFALVIPSLPWHFF